MLALLARLSVPVQEGRHALVDAEVVGDDVYVQESKDEQRDGDHAEECEHDQDKARDEVGRGVSWAMSRASRRCEHRERFGGHRIRILRRRFA